MSTEPVSIFYPGTPTWPLRQCLGFLISASPLETRTLESLEGWSNLARNTVCECNSWTHTLQSPISHSLLQVFFSECSVLSSPRACGVSLSSDLFGFILLSCFLLFSISQTSWFVLSQPGVGPLSASLSFSSCPDTVKHGGYTCSSVFCFQVWGCIEGREQQGVIRRLLHLVFQTQYVRMNLGCVGSIRYPVS